MPGIIFEGIACQRCGTNRRYVAKNYPNGRCVECMNRSARKHYETKVKPRRQQQCQKNPDAQSSDSEWAIAFLKNLGSRWE